MHHVNGDGYSERGQPHRSAPPGFYSFATNYRIIGVSLRSTPYSTQKTFSCSSSILAVVVFSRPLCYSGHTERRTASATYAPRHQNEVHRHPGCGGGHPVMHWHHHRLGAWLLPLSSRERRSFRVSRHPPRPRTQSGGRQAIGGTR